MSPLLHIKPALKFARFQLHARTFKIPAAKYAGHPIARKEATDGVESNHEQAVSM
jgi:hypothetical protein